MDTNTMTGAIIGGGILVSNALGVGYLEKVYENALAHEIRKVGLRVLQHPALTVTYDGIEVGHYTPDLLVEEQIIVELKAARAIDPAHEAQVLNYLRATNLRTGLILNFGTPRLGIRRMHL
jgi:GxxExxY protein